MPFVPKDLTGRMFDNRADRKNKSQPDYSGTVSIAGTVYRIAGWYNPPNERSNVATIGLSLEPYDEYQRRRNAEETAAPGRPKTQAPTYRPAAPAQPAQTDFDDDDEIPF